MQTYSPSVPPSAEARLLVAGAKMAAAILYSGSRISPGETVNN